MPPELAAALLDALNEAPAARAETHDTPDGGVELTGPRELLREAVLVAIDEAGEALSARCTGLLRGEGGGGEVRVAVARLSGLLELLERLER